MGPMTRALGFLTINKRKEKEHGEGVERTTGQGT